MQPVLQALTAEYTRRHPNILFTINGGGSTLGEEMAINRRVDLGASTLFPPNEPTAAQRSLVRVPIGVDGLTLIVHHSNVITELTTMQLRDLYSGNILDWAEVGGEPGEVLLVSREDGSGSRIFFEDKVMQGDEVSLTAVVMPTSRDVLEYIAKTPNAIGYVSRAWVMGQDENSNATRTPTPPLLNSEGITQVLPQTLPPRDRVKILSIDGVSPSMAALRTRAYPLIQPLYLVSRGQTQGNVRQFIDFVLSPPGQNIVRRYHLPVR